MELGSFYELDQAEPGQAEDNIYGYLKDYHTIYTDSGRSAARILNGMIPKGKILLPSYICQSVINVYKKDFWIAYYQVKEDLSIDIEDLRSRLDESVTAVYLMHYFGQMQDGSTLDSLEKMKTEYHFCIIEDTTHSIFTKSSAIGDYGICSLRKWLPIPDGGVLYSKRELPVQSHGQKNPEAGLKAMHLKYDCIHRGADGRHEYRSLYEQEENELDAQTDILGISRVSEELLKGYSIEELKRKRRENYLYLQEHLPERIQEQGLEMILTGTDFVPLTLPLYLDNRDAFRQYMTEHRIYCAVHWPVEEVYLQQNPVTERMAGRMISLPLDQRYDTEHMDYLIRIINEYAKDV